MDTSNNTWNMEDISSARVLYRLPDIKTINDRIKTHNELMLNLTPSEQRHFVREFHNCLSPDNPIKAYTDYQLYNLVLEISIKAINPRPKIENSCAVTKTLYKILKDVCIVIPSEMKHEARSTYTLPARDTILAKGDFYHERFNFGETVSMTRCLSDNAGKIYTIVDLYYLAHYLLKKCISSRQITQEDIMLIRDKIEEISVKSTKTDTPLESQKPSECITTTKLDLETKDIDPNTEQFVGEKPCFVILPERKVVIDSISSSNELGKRFTIEERLRIGDLLSNYAVDHKSVKIDSIARSALWKVMGEPPSNEYVDMVCRILKKISKDTTEPDKIGYVKVVTPDVVFEPSLEPKTTVRKDIDQVFVNTEGILYTLPGRKQIKQIKDNHLIALKFRNKLAKVFAKEEYKTYSARDLYEFVVHTIWEVSGSDNSTYNPSDNPTEHDIMIAYHELRGMCNAPISLVSDQSRCIHPGVARMDNTEEKCLSSAIEKQVQSPDQRKAVDNTKETSLVHYRVVVDRYTIKDREAIFTCEYKDDIPIMFTIELTGNSKLEIPVGDSQIIQTIISSLNNMMSKRVP